MNVKLRQLQDEAAKVVSEIESLRAIEAADENEATTIEENLAAACQRSDELIAEIETQTELEEKREAALAGLKASLSTDAQEGKNEERKAPAIHVAKAGTQSTDSDESAGLFLRSLARGEHRAMAGGSTGAGAELTAPAEVYDQIINVINRQSVAVQVASVFNTNAKKLTLPKVAEGSADLYSEAASVTPSDLTTSGVDVTLYGLRKATAISNDLIEDSVVDVAQLFSTNTANAFATKIDSAWLQGETVGSDTITGLVSAVTSSVTVSDASSTAAADLADMVGAVDPLAANTSWVVSPAGFGALLAANVGTGAVMVTDAMRPTVFGRPVYVTNGLPSGTLALYGDFSFSSAVVLKASGLRVEALRELQALDDRTVFVAKQRIGIANHAEEFVSKLVTS